MSLVRSPLALALASVLLLSACGPGANNGAVNEADPADVAAASDTTPAATPADAPPAPAAAAVPMEPPTFDCAGAEEEARKLICGDAALAALDRRLADEFGKALSRTSGDSKELLQSDQRNWIRERDGCWTEDDLAACVRRLYHERLLALHVADRGSAIPPTVTLRCDSDAQMASIVYYTDLDPAAAIVTLGEDRASVFAQPTGSGTHYAGDRVDLREHQGEITLDFRGTTLKCVAN